MADNPEQEREEIRNGRQRLRMDSVDPLRAAVIALGNGHSIPQDALASLIATEEADLVFRARDAELNEMEAPSRPGWLDPAYSDPAICPTLVAATASRKDSE